jgi:hypothetical protein
VLSFPDSQIDRKANVRIFDGTVPRTACQHQLGRTLAPHQFFSTKNRRKPLRNRSRTGRVFNKKEFAKCELEPRIYWAYTYDRVESKTLNRTYPITYNARSFVRNLLFHPIQGQKFAFCEPSNRPKHPRPPHFTGRRPNRKIFFAPTKRLVS